MMDKISTSALAKERSQEPAQLFAELRKAGYIYRNNDKWALTDRGAHFGGEYARHPEYGEFIIWPRSLCIDLTAIKGALYNATTLGERYHLSAKKINLLLNELGWISKTENGWLLSESGRRAGGEQKSDAGSGNHYVLWHDSIMHNKMLRQTIAEFSGVSAETEDTHKSYSAFRQKFSAKYRTLDGHYVHSQGELKIDNWLYMAGVVHAYQRRLPIAKDIICDFYLPGGKVYLQYWQQHTADSEKAQLRQVYQGNNFNLIEIESHETDELDNLLPARLRPFGIQAY